MTLSPLGAKYRSFSLRVALSRSPARLALVPTIIGSMIWRLSLSAALSINSRRCLGLRESVVRGSSLGASRESL